MNFLLLSDIHATDRNPVARKDNLMDAFVEKFEFVLKYASKKNAVILQAGDLFDSPRNWTVLNYLSKALYDFKENYDFKPGFMTVFGQHDMFLRGEPEKTPSAMLTLINLKVIRLLKKTRFLMNKEIDIYGSNFGEEVPEIIDHEKKNILVIHKSISEKSEWKGHEYETPKSFLKKNKFDLILVGDIHKEFCVENFQKRFIVNTGPMLRLDANEYNFQHKPCFYLWNSKNGSLKRVEIPHKKASLVLTRDHIKKNKASRSELEAFVKNLRNVSGIKDLRKNRIWNYINKNVKDRAVKKIIREIIDEHK